MNKYISKALIYDKKKEIILFSQFIFFMYAINLLDFFSKLIREGYSNYTILLNLGVFLPSVFVISLTIDLYTNKEAKYFHLLTEPQKRDRVAITNLLIPILSFTFALILYGIIVTIIFVTKGYALNTIGLLWNKLIFIFALLLLINSLIQISQMLFGNYIAAFVIPLFFSVGIPFSLGFLSKLVSDKISLFKNLLNYMIDIYAKHFVVFFETIGFAINNDTASIVYSPESVTNINLLIPFILFVLSIILMFLTIKLNERLKLENITKIFMFKWVEKIFFIVTSLVSLTIITLVITITFPILDINNQNVLLIIDICLIPLSILVYKIVSKVWYKATC